MDGISPIDGRYKPKISKVDKNFNNKIQESKKILLTRVKLIEHSLYRLCYIVYRKIPIQGYPINEPLSSYFLHSLHTEMFFGLLCR